MMLLAVSGGLFASGEVVVDGAKIFSRFTAGLFERMAEKTQPLRSVSRDQVRFYNLYASSPAEWVSVQADFSDSLLALNPSALVFFSNDYQESWGSSDCYYLGSAGYETTWQCDFTTDGGGYLAWYMRAEFDYENERAYVTQGPQNDENAFPPSDNTMVIMSDEPAGDQENADGSLDLTEVRATYSQDRLFVRLQTAEGQFPVGEFFGPWYLYGVGFLNPEQDLNSDQLVIYALGYGNGAFGNLYPGLMKLIGSPNGEILSADYISDDIEYQIVGNSLYLSVAMDLIVNDPDFGTWPNEFNGFLLMGLTASADINQNMVFHDGTTPGMLMMDLQTQAGNNPLVISDPYFDPETAELSVFYSDADANLPIRHEVNHLSDVWEMIPDTHQYEDGTFFRYTLTDPQDGFYNVIFDYSDGSTSQQLSYTFTIGDVAACLLPGDATGDGSVDVLDVVWLVNVILCADCPTDDPCLDVTQDGSVDVLDVVLLVNIILSG